MIRLILYSMQSHVLDYTSGDVSHEHYITLVYFCSAENIKY